MRAAVGVRRPGWPLLAVLALVVAANAHTLTTPFISDDWALLHHLQEPGGFRYYTQLTGNPLYRPMAWGGVAVLHTFFGLHPVPYHVVALLFVLGACAALRAAALRVGLGQGAAAIAALALGVHPAVAWGVGWMACLGSPMGDFFGALALLVLLAPAPTRRQQWSGAALCVLAMGAHETFAALLPVVLLLRLGLDGAGAGARARVATALRGTGPVLAVVGGLVVFQALHKSPPAISEYRDQPIGFHVVRHIGTLLEQLPGPVLAAPGRIGTAPGVVAAALVWVVLVASAVAAQRAGHRVALPALAATVPACYPIAILVHHSMDPYYLEVALLPFALAVGSVAQTYLDALPRRLELPAVGAVAGLGALLGGLVMASNLDAGSLGALRREQDSLIAQAHARYPGGLPSSFVLTSTNIAESSIATYKGWMFGVLEHDPSMSVRLTAP